MTLQLNFSQMQINPLLRHIEWLKEIGIIESYDFKSSDAGMDDFEITEAEFQKLLQASLEVKNGKFFTHEEVKSKMATWQNNS